MTNIIKYKPIDGTIPNYIITGDGSCSGQYQNPNGSYLLGLGSVTGSESDVTIFNTKAELIAYMETYMTGWTSPIIEIDGQLSDIPVDIPAAANRLWSFL